MVLGQCRLCLESDRALLRSHILPEAFYRGALKGKKAFPIYSSGSRDPISVNHQKGLRERLLCKDCESRFSRWETYGLGLMWNRTPADGIERSAYVEYRVEYDKLKLFHLSLLWRMAVAQHDIFSNVWLGPKHEARLRTMLVAGDPGPAYAYPCLLAAIAEPAAPISALMILPVKRRTTSGHHNYDLFARGFLWQFIVSGHAHSIPQDELPLSENGIMRVYKKGTIPAVRYMTAIEAVAKRKSRAVR